MTATYDPTTATRLIAEAREVTTRTEPDLLAWLALHADLGVPSKADRIKLHAVHDELWSLRASNRAMADQIEAAMALIGEHGDVKALERAVEHALNREGRHLAMIEALLAQRVANGWTAPTTEQTIDRQAGVMEALAEMERKEMTDAEMHAARYHPDFEYEITTGPRKLFCAGESPPGEGWQRNTFVGDGGRCRYDHHEESYWMRRKVVP